MSKSLTKTNNPKTTNPNLPPIPTPRDLQIYKGYVILNRDQASIAMNLNISRVRISQVVKKVKRWLAAGGAPSDPEIREHLAQENLSHANKRIRLLRIIEKANYAAEHTLPSQKTTKTRYHGTTAVWHEETAVLAPEVNLPALRVLLSAIKTLDELEARHAEPASPDARRGSPDPAATSEDQLLLSVFELLCRWRTKAEAAGHFPRSTNIRELIAENLHSMLGPIASALGNPSADTHSTSAYIAADVSALEPALIVPTPDQLTTSGNALTSPE